MDNNMFTELTIKYFIGGLIVGSVLTSVVFGLIVIAIEGIFHKIHNDRIGK